MRRNNKGLTLIELVVTVAIIAIFSGVVLTFISTGANSYRNTSNNAEVQMETQQVLDQIQDLVIAANRSVYYASGSLDSIGSNEIKSDIDQDWADGAVQKHFVVCNAKEATDTEGDYIWDIITWDSSTKELTYRSKSKRYEKKTSTDQNDTNPASQAFALADEGDSQNQPSETEGEGTSQDNDTTETLVGDEQDIVLPTVLAHDITSFRADVTKVESEGIVRFQIITNKKGKEIKTINTVNLRNKIKVQAPDLNLEDLPTENAKIYITNAKDLSSDCGSYIFTKSMIGDILPNTVVWSVEGAGCSFPTEDKTSGKMTVDPALPTRTVTVKVTAQTASGNSASDEKTITITKKRTATGLTPTTDTLILGVGNQYDLNDLVTGWKIVYSDGTQGKQVDSVQWSGTIGSSSVSSNGIITIPSDIGTGQGNSLYTLIVTSQISGVTISGSIEVRIARLDILRPIGKYYVGDEKTFEYQYKEGGEFKTKEVELYVINKENSSVMPYSVDNRDVFLESEVGSWRLTAKISIPYGKTLSAESDFTVAEIVYEGQITLPNSAVVAGNSYLCSDTHDYGFRFIKNWTDQKYSLEWNIENAYDNRTTINNSNDNSATIMVGENEKGFILCVNYKKYKGGNSDDIIKEIIIKRPVNVAYKIEIPEESLPNEVMIGNQYELYINMTIGSITEDGTRSEIVKKVRKSDVDVTLDWLEGINDGNISGDIWTVSSNYNKGKIITAKSVFQNSSDIFMGDHKRYLSTEKTVMVKEPEVELEIVGIDEGYVNEPCELWLKAIVDGEIKTDLNVQWSSWDWSGSSISREESKVSFNKINSNTYPITASIVVNGKTYSITKQLIIKEHQVTCEIKESKGRTSVLIGDTLMFYVDVRIDGNVTDDYQLEWYKDWPLNDTNSTVEEKKLTHKTDTEGTGSVRAKVTVKEKAYYPNAYSFTVTKLSIKITKSKNTFYPNSVPFQFEAKVYEGEDEVTSKYPYKWRYEWIDANKTCDVTIDNQGTLTPPSVISESCQLSLIAYVEQYQNIKDAKIIYFYPQKNIKSRQYIIEADGQQTLEMDNEDSGKNIVKVSLSVQYLNGTIESTEGNKISGFILDKESLTITAPSDISILGLVNSVKVTVELDDVIYIFTILPQINNIYNSNGSSAGYALPPEESILDNAVWDSDLFSHVWTNTRDNRTYEFRYSISAVNGVGFWGGLLGDSSLYKWFMKCQDTNKYYIYVESENAWKEFTNSDGLRRTISDYWLTGNQKIKILIFDKFKEDLWKNWG